MADEQKTVFISYRRKVAWEIARAVFQDLRANGYDVFMDVESIDSGNFEQIIFSQIEARAHFLIILTAGTVNRYAEENDMMRREIEYAIGQGRNIVPVMISSFKFNKRTLKYFTGNLAGIPKLNGVPVPPEYFEEAMTRLRTRFLKKHVDVAVKSIPVNLPTELQRKIEEVATQSPPTEIELIAEDYNNKGLALVDGNE